ncbi:MAG: hypothetical protein SFV32_02160 [Opitutaceae bacterium]|nr:hypothetical protein [Opitutaceae bacterium]
MSRLLLFAFLVGADCAMAQMIVNDPPLTSLAYQQVARLAELNAQLTRANGTLAELVRYTGDTRASLARVDDLSTFVTNVGRMGAPRYKVDVASSAVRVPEAMERSENPYRKSVGTAVRVRERTEKRDPRIYEDELRFEGAVTRARELLETNRAHQHTLLGRLSTANDNYERARNLADLHAAALEIQRLQALMAGADALSANLHRDISLARLEMELGRSDKRKRRAEVDRLLAIGSNEKADELRVRLEERRGRALAEGRTPRSHMEKTGPWANWD